MSAMDDSNNSKEASLLKDNENVSDVNDNVITEKSVRAKKYSENTAEWSLVYFETDEDIDEGFHDLIPSSWITGETLSWYPMDENRAIINKLVKQCRKPDLEWDCFSIKKIEENIENYDRGMKMLVKIAKNPNATLYSDIEEKGKGKRLKKQIKYFDESDKENNFKKKLKMQLPPIPKLTSLSKSAHSSHPLLDKMNKKVNCQTLSLDNNEQQSVFLSHRINVPYEISKKSHKECKGIKRVTQESSHLLTEMNKSTSTTIASEGCSHENFSLSGCKMHSKMNHKCAYTSEGEVTLESVADAICYLSVEILSSKLILRKTDKNIESFMETQTTMDKLKTENPIIVPVLDEFPITNLDDLKKIERKLKTDNIFHSKVVDALHLGIIGESSVQKKINFVLRMVLDDKLASFFNWKGQRGTKMKLEGRRITKIMIEAMAKEIPAINQIMFGRKAGSWLAQASFRIKNRQNKKDDESRADSSSDSGDKISDEEYSTNNENEQNI